MLPVEEHPRLVEQYLLTNQVAFGQLGLPRWVLSDLYLLPAAIGVFLCEARFVREDLRLALRVPGGREVIGAAYVGVPTIHPGVFVGVSLLSFLEDRHCAAWAKSLTVKMLGAKQVRGVAQWDSPSLRVHTRLGPLRLIGRPPGGHELAEKTFVYETDLSDESGWAEAMERRSKEAATSRIAVTDLPVLNAALDRAQQKKIEIVAPGLDDGHVLLRE
jgi:hypothetical protein